jgi:hypothetical protein
LYMTRIMHLIIIGENLPQLSHLHPTFEDNGENLKICLIFQFK